MRRRKKKKKKKKTGFRVELRAKSNFESNARGKLRQTIYFFWPYKNKKLNLDGLRSAKGYKSWGINYAIFLC